MKENLDSEQPIPPSAPHQEVDSEIYFDGRPSILLLIPTLIKSLILATFGVGTAWFVDWEAFLSDPYAMIEALERDGPSLQPILVLTILILGFLSVAVFLYGIFIWLSTQYRITNDRIEYERGIFSKTVLNVELWRVRDIFFRRTLIHFFLGLGVIDILATDDTIPRLEIGPVRGARCIYDRLKQARLKSGRLAGAQAMGMSTS